MESHEVLIITGLSGACKTSVMRALEDVGFYCVDNLPVPLMHTFLTLAAKNKNIPRIALGIDARSEPFLANLLTELQHVSSDTQLCTPKIIFLNARQQTLIQRFQETRRKHPLADKKTLESAIEHEIQTLEPIKKMAHMIVDTDVLNIHELRNWVRTTLSDDKQRELVVNIVSFGFKYGVPAESNLVYDLRFLPNPYFIPALKSFDGRSDMIQSFLFTSPAVQDYWPRLYDFLTYSLNKFYTEGRFFATVALGCTGGKHRSVAFVEKIVGITIPNIRFVVTHRDIEKE